MKKLVLKGGLVCDPLKKIQRICDVLIIDSQDLHEIKNIEKLGINAVATNTIMNSDKDKIELAEFILDIIKNQP